MGLPFPDFNIFGINYNDRYRYRSRLQIFRAEPSSFRKGARVPIGVPWGEAWGWVQVGGERGGFPVENELESQKSPEKSEKSPMHNPPPADMILFRSRPGIPNQRKGQNEKFI